MIRNFFYADNFSIRSTNSVYYLGHICSFYQCAFSNASSLIMLCLYSRINLYGTANILGSTISVLVDVLLEAFISNVHLAKSCKNLVRTGVVVGGYMCLKLRNKRLRLDRISLCPLLFCVILRLLLVFVVNVCATSTLANLCFIVVPLV